MRAVNLYQIYDTNAEQALGTIMAVNRDGPAIRTFFDVLGNSETELAKHPNDFELRHIGIQDLDTGAIASLLDNDKNPTTRTVISGAQWREMEDSKK